MTTANLTTVQKERMLSIIYDVFDVATSLKSAAPLFPKSTALESGEISASLTVKAFAAVLEKHIGTLLDIVNDEDASPQVDGGAA